MEGDTWAIYLDVSAGRVVLFKVSRDHQADRLCRQTYIIIIIIIIIMIIASCAQFQFRFNDKLNNKMKSVLVSIKYEDRYESSGLSERAERSLKYQGRGSGTLRLLH